jgi:Holliday junction resolvase RusA-like endonuclease
MEVTLIFQGHIPSKKNSKRIANGRILPSKAYESWHKAELATLQDAFAIPSPVEIEYSFRIGGKDRPREFDLSNAEESINDLLVDAGIIEDDSWLHLISKKSTIEGFYRGSGRCEVTIRHVPGVAWRNSILALKNESAINRIKELTGRSKTAIRDGLWTEITL